MEVSWGFLRPSLEETLAFNRSRSVGDEEEAEVVGTYQIRFLLFFFCLSFVLLSCFTFVAFLCLPWIFTRSLLYYVGIPVPLSLDFFGCGWPPLLRKVPKRGWWTSCGRALLDRVCLSLERGLPPRIQGQVSVRWRFAWFAGRFRCLFFRWISLVRFAESRSFCCLSGWWFVLYLCKRLLWWSERMY